MSYVRRGGSLDGLGFQAGRSQRKQNGEDGVGRAYELYFGYFEFLVLMESSRGG